MYVVAMPSDLGAHPRPGYNKAIVHKVSISCIADCIRWNQLYQNKIASSRLSQSDPACALAGWSN
jgi:hypothetical protein